MQKEILNNVNLEELKPYSNNYLKHENNIDFIKNSLGTFGYVKISIAVDENNVLLAGHGTLEAIKQLKWDNVPEVLKITGLTDKQKKAYRIADNSTTKGSIIDVGKLHFEIKEIDNEFALEDFGLDIAPVDFAPMLDPDTNKINVSEEDIENTQNKLDGAFENTENKKLVNTICPNCGQKFSFNG